VYMNNAGQAQLDQSVVAAGIACVQKPAWEMDAEEDAKIVRTLFAQMIHASPTNIAIMPSTAFAITLAAHNLKFQLEGQKGRILVLQDQMCSSVYPWEHLCSRSGGYLELDIVSYPSASTTWTDKVITHLKNGQDKILVACLPPLHWADGALLDLVEISKICRDIGAFLVVDATQAVGVYPCDISLFSPALLACSVHKWLRGPSGASLVYIDPKLQNTWEPLDQHGRSRKVAGMAIWNAAKDGMGPQGYPQEFVTDARRFDSGGKPSPFLLPMLRKSMLKVIEVDIEKIQSLLKDRMMPLLDWADKHELWTPSVHAYHLIGIRVRHLSPEQMILIKNKLEGEHDVHIAVRCGAFRISPYLDTTEENVQKLIEALSATVLL
jgi:selenocysteine lyase/cysteine desulfurase